MRVAFVGVKRKYRELPESYRMDFTRYHLELPYYFARDGEMDVVVTTVDGYDGAELFDESGRHVSILAHTSEENLGKWYDHKTGEMVFGAGYDVVVHWRKWFPEFYRPEAINVINCQDHSFSSQWKADVVRAYAEKKLYGILCFPKWHKTNLYRELEGNVDAFRLVDGLTLGVDTDIYSPSPDKDPYQLLWASDPGRGLQQCLQMFMQLHVLDSRFRLNVCWPDYCSPPTLPRHPGFNPIGNVSNGPRLWNLFNDCGVLPYTSTFMEPSSRAHRQAMAAGSLVLYPPGMGTPSDLIEDNETGIVRSVREWPRIIHSFVSTGTWKKIGERARQYAISESWAVQANRFRKYFEGVLGEKTE